VRSCPKTKKKLIIIKGGWGPGNDRACGPKRKKKKPVRHLKCYWTAKGKFGFLDSDFKGNTWILAFG
jgi:hypothetical protein